MKIHFLLISAFVLYCNTIYAQSRPIVSPIQMGAYMPGIINPRDYANPGTSGLMALDYNLFFNSDQYIDRYGNKTDHIEVGISNNTVPIEIDMTGYLNALAIVYVSPELGFIGKVRYLGFISPYYATSDYRIALSELILGDTTVTGNTGGLGDLTIAPIYLTWAVENQKWDVTGGYMFSAPTGRYETGADDNIGLGYWNYILQVFTYYYPLPEKATAIFLGNSFEFHSKIKDADVRPGNRYAIDYGISQYLSERFEVTIQGGNNWQVGDDSGDDVYWDTSFKDRYSTIGVGLGFWPVKQKFYTHLKWWTNYAIRQHFKTNNLQLQLIYIPGVLMAKTDKI